MKQPLVIALALVAGLTHAWGAPHVLSKPPAEILDLSRWLLTLPIDSQRPGNPDEIKQPELGTFSDPNHFCANEKGDGVIFRAECGGRTTKGSSYPRSELREMAGQDDRRAAWNTDGELHQLSMRLAVTRTPAKKQHVVCAQIHDADDDLLMIRLEGTKLFIERNSIGDVMLDRKYELGRPFDLRIQAGRGVIRVWHNEELKLEWPVSRAGCYFKAGCYTQSNTKKGDASDSYGEVTIYRLELK